MVHDDQPTEQSQKVKLSEMPIEILEQILINLDDEHLLAASLVCKLFAAVAERAFAKNYDNEPYEICDSSERKKSFHKIMVSKYGGKMRKLKITDQDEQLLDLVEQNCCNLRNIYLNGVPRMIHLKGLKGIGLNRVRNLNRDTFTELIENNRDLEFLAIRKNAVDLIDILDGRVNALKRLEYHCKTKLANNLTQIRLDSLETLKLKLCTDFPSIRDTARLLRAIKCDGLKKLVLENFYWNANTVIVEICKFELLETLRLPWCLFTANELRQLAWNLPHVTKFSMSIDLDESTLEQSISSVLTTFPKLIKLKIMMEDDAFNKVLPDLQKSIYDFYARFGKTNTVIRIANDFDFVLVAKDRIILYLQNQFGQLFLDGSLEIHWMDSLNEKTMRKIMNREWNAISELKFINNCAESILDVSTLIDSDTDFDEIHCLDFQSVGMVSINANVSAIELKGRDVVPESACTSFLSHFLVLRLSIN